MENPDSNPHPKLSQDLITEILIRLPAKPLARFKTVSKQWSTLITSRPFLLRYITHASKSLPTLHLARFVTPTLDTLHLSTLESPSTPSPLTSLSLPFTPTSQFSDIFGSAHGLLGISDYPNFLSLYNPTNNTFHLIKPPLLQPHNEAHWVDFGLGYDPLLHDYKFLMINQLNGGPSLPSPPEVRVYTLKKDPTWRKLNHTFPHYLAFPGTYTHAKYVGSSNSLLYIGAVNPPKIYHSNTPITSYSPLGNNYRLVQLNLTTETFTVSLFPEFDNDGRYYGKEMPFPFITVSKTDLILQVGYGPAKERAVDMWVKREYGAREKEGEWEKLFRFGLDVDGPKYGVKGYVRPVVVLNDGEEVLIENMCSYFWYKVKSGEIREVEIEGGVAGNYQFYGGFPHQTRAVVYHESLVVLDNCGLEFAEEDNDDDDDSKGVVILKPGIGALKMSMAECRKYLQGRSSASIFSGVD